MEQSGDEDFSKYSQPSVDADLMDRLHGLTYSHLPSFISNNECLKNLEVDLSDVTDQCDHLASGIPHLCDSISVFADDSKGIFEKWRNASLMLARYQSLLEILEIPQMMETSVRSNNYEEALRLRTFVLKLKAKFGSQIPLLENVVNDIEKAQEMLVMQLLNELKSNIHLPQCIKVMNYLKKMEKYPESELRFKFLTVRDTYFQNLLKEIPQTPPLFHLTKSVEVFRVNLFDIVTQYKAVFSDDSPESPSNFPLILSSWVSTKINQFFNIIEQDMICCIESEPFFPYDSIIDPCYYFGQSMTRIGADMRPRLTSLFQKMCLKRLRLSLDRAEKEFTESLTNWPPENWKLPDVSLSNSPKLVFQEMTPLKALVNGMLSSLNDIRLISCLMMTFSITDVINKSLVRSSQILLEYCRCDRADENTKAQLCNHFIHSFLPYLRSCVENLFPPNHLSKTLGISLVEYQKLVEISEKNLIWQIDFESSRAILADYVKEGIEDRNHELLMSNVDLTDDQPEVSEVPKDGNVSVTEPKAEKKCDDRNVAKEDDENVENNTDS